jgi:hypothetical protein
MYSVYQHWDPLKVCIVGRSYPPEFYSWIVVPHVRSLFEKIAIETEEDYQHIIKKLQEFGVEILRPDLPTNTFINGKYVPPPMIPRDHMVMVGNTFYSPFGNTDGYFKDFYNRIKDSSWPDCNTQEEFFYLPNYIQTECKQIHQMDQHITDPYSKIINIIKQQGNNVKLNNQEFIHGASLTRIGKDL